MAVWFLMSCLAVSGAGTQAPIAFEPELVFGADDSRDAYLWPYAATTVDADAEGRMYVSDPAGNRVLAFDAAGRFLRVVARPGQGPGELIGLCRFAVLADGTAQAFEKQGGSVARLQRFGADMAYLSSAEKPLIMETATLSPRGDRLCGFVIEIDPGAGVMRYQTAAFNASLEKLKVFTEARGPLPDRSRMNDPAYWVERIGDNLRRVLSGTGVFAYDADGRL